MADTGRSSSSNPWGQAEGAGHAVALEVLLHGPLSRAELARRLDLSQPTLTRLAKSLLRSDLFVELPTRIDSATGRPTVPLDAASQSRMFIGVRQARSEVQAVLTTIRAEVVARDSERIQSKDPASLIAAVVAVVGRLRQDVELSGVGLSIAGRVQDHRVATRWPGFAWSYPVDLAGDLSGALGVPVVIDNDVLALARYHTWFGRGKLAAAFALITLDGAIGYALTSNHRVLERPDTGIGVLGHLPLDPFGPVCDAGHRGCAHAMLSPSSIASAVSVPMGRPVSFAECLQLANAGNLPAVQVVAASGRALGRLIGYVTTCSLTDEVVIAGEAGGLVEAARPHIDAGIADIRQPETDPVRLHVEPPTSDPWSVGAASTAITDYVFGLSDPTR